MTDNFDFRIVRPTDSDGSVLVLLHGTGGDENDLIPLGTAVAPRSTLIGVRGRSTSEPSLRWFSRSSTTVFDQEEIIREAAAFAAFLPRLLSRESGGREGVNSKEQTPENVALLGFSNGANFIGALLLLHPGLVRRAVLWRPMPVLEDPLTPSLEGSDVLLIGGRDDPYGKFMPQLAQLLRERQANVSAHMIGAGHGLTQEDLAITSQWLANESSKEASQQ